MGKRRKTNWRKLTPDTCKKFKDSFVNLSNLPSNSNFGLTVNTVKYQTPDTSKSESTDNLLTNSKLNQALCGISSFQGFVMTTPNCIASTNASEVDTENRTENSEDVIRLNSLLTEKKEKLIPTPVIYPNILKRKDHKNSFVSMSPMKMLTFSPSKFLNTSSKEDSDDSDTSRDITSNSSFDAEDSGIGCSDIDGFSPLPPSLTSTPCTRSRRKVFQQTISGEPFLPEKDDLFITTPISLQSNSDLVDTDVKDDPQNTPLIRKFLNESAPRTPTPFKCPDASHLRLDNDTPLKAIQDQTSSPPENDDSCFKRPSPVTALRWKNSARKSTFKKTVKNKASFKCERNIKRSLFQIEDKTISSKLFKTEHADGLTRFDQSALVDDNAIVEKRSSLLGGKSVYFTRKKRACEIKKKLDNQWVSVACGRSFDQKVMTEAAKRCLRKRFKGIYSF